jgi:hypothetical protein
MQRATKSNLDAHAGEWTDAVSSVHTLEYYAAMKMGEALPLGGWMAPIPGGRLGPQGRKHLTRTSSWTQPTFVDPIPAAILFSSHLSLQGPPVVRGEINQGAVGQALLVQHVQDPSWEGRLRSTHATIPAEHRLSRP